MKNEEQAVDEVCHSNIIHEGGSIRDVAINMCKEGKQKIW